MKISIWTITGGSDKKRIEKLKDSLEGKNLNILNYGKEPLLIDETVEFSPSDLPCIVAHDTYFTANVNRILTKAIDEGYDYALILNDDITFEKGALDALIEAGDNYPDPWAIMNPVQVAMKNRKKVLMAGTGKAYPAGEHMTGDRKKLNGEITRWRWLPFCAPLFNLKAVRAIGLLNPTMRMWFSDSDYCIRARYAGFDITLASSSIIRHINHASVQAGQEPFVTLFRADQAAFARMWNGDPMRDLSS